MLVKKRDRGISLLKAASLTALVGHWVANVLFDRDQYEGAAPEVVARLNDPIAVQALVVVVALVALTAWERRRVRALSRPFLENAGRLQLLAILVVLQAGLFVGMEVSERFTIAALSSEPVHVGLFGDGFLAEVLVALPSALALALVGARTVQIIESFRSSPLPARAESVTAVLLDRVFARRCLVLAGAGGVRAPPLTTPIPLYLH